jgi:RNA polymerase sigma factor (sigma-70 family)
MGRGRAAALASLVNPSSSSKWVTTSTILRDLEDFGDREAWDRFADRFRAPVVHLAREMGLVRADAEDVAQETLLAFAKAYREGRYDSRRGRLSGWLFAIAYRQALRSRRSRDERRGRERPRGDGTQTWSDVADRASATRTWDQEWERAILARCLERVKNEVQPETFRAFELVVRERRDPDEAASELGLPVKAVYNAKHRILKRVRELRESIEDVSGDPR